MSKRLLTLLAVFAMVAAVFGSYAAGVVFARHYVHSGMDPDSQITTAGNTLPENHVNVKWALHDRGKPITWHAEAAVRDLFSNALAKWTAGVPRLRWQEANNSSDADVSVFQNPRCDGLSAYFEVNSGTTTNPDLPGGWHTDNDRDANYWKKAIICLASNFSLPTTDDYRLAVAVHEIGHAYGLDEVYTDDQPVVGSVCNDSVTSVMDGGHIIQPTPPHGRRLAPCDVLTGPSHRDLSTVRDFFTSGGPVDFTSELSGNRGTFRWRDDA